MTEDTGVGLVHHYMRGIRFEGLWEYQVRSPSGRMRWKQLSMHSESAQTLDEDGFEWCLRRCAAVMAQQPLRKAKIDAELSELGPDANQWKRRLPNCAIWRFNEVGESVKELLAIVLKKGGCALMKLELQRNQPKKQESDVCWVWVVGLELQRVSVADRLTRTMAALVVSQTWAAPWASGFGARISWDDAGQCVLCSVDGHRLQGQCFEMVAIEPKY
ncbi:hypothetical protein [Lampropedia aestuarii]|uniref:hypothetical protein n=1 Tax=Lampropedia aestuarii TaxID=2562762 RepID=UPI0024689523|nr:hypothetical protein [Lampropedia aestuarii]MDH5858810.1 hypothetical protein [Lampropedia aestuarii]